MKKISKRRLIQVIACLPITLGFLSSIKVMSALIIISTVLAGAFYCGYLCPFGLIQDLGISIRKHLKIRKKVLPKKIDKYLRYLRYLIYIGVTYLSAEWLIRLLKFDPRSNFYLLLTGKVIERTMLMSILIFFLLSILIDRPFCKYLCMKGAFYGLLSKLRIISIVRSSDSCVNCGKCDRVCPMGVQVSTKPYVNSMDCINCFECVKACPIKDTLCVKAIPKRHLHKKVALIGLVAVVFITVQYGKSNLHTDTEIEVLEPAVASAESTESNKATEAVEEALDYYTGVGEGYNGEITVKIGVLEGEIRKIKVIDHSEDYEWYVEAKKPIINGVIDAQSTDIDVVSGATYTSNGLLEAIENAIQKIE